PCSYRGVACRPASPAGRTGSVMEPDTKTGQLAWNVGRGREGGGGGLVVACGQDANV
ncbi:hypothetical protein GGI11_009046, partial [Coemansia sp. RSA 2049]